MSNYTEFFLNCKANVRLIQTLEISHPNFSKTYFVVRNPTSKNGMTLTLETGGQQFFEYRPLTEKGLGVNNTLDQVLEISFGDNGTILPQELDLVAAADGFRTKPTVIARDYRSDDLNAPLVGPITLEASTLTFNGEYASFQAAAPSVNNNKTGEIYSFDRFPMLRGFV